MDTLKNKQYAVFDYTSRYITVPYYFDTICNREVFGIGKNMNFDLPWVAHKVTAEDSLDALALKYYNNPTFWWVIAYFNNLQDPFVKLYGNLKTIKIPSITSIKFEDARS